MSKPRFSIIVPVYNVEQYLAQCISSVLEQTFDKYELILVDDGSPDRCGEMCDEYSKTSVKIRTVHKENGGLSSARNAGLDVATGEYIIFLDSDDFWDDSKALENIDRNLSETDADVLVFPAKRYYGGNTLSTNIINIPVDREKVMDLDVNRAITYLLTYNIYRAAAWNKVIHHSIIQEHHMRFKEGYLSEDMDWCGDLLLFAKRFDYYDVPFYSYRQQRDGSITKRSSKKLISDKIFMCEKGLSQALDITDRVKGSLLASYYAYEYSVLLGVSGNIEDREILDQIKNLRVLLDYDTSNKVKKVNKLKRIVGFKLTRIFLCFFVEIKNRR